ncbi:hypothetical protein [Streptomyces sp. NPDC050564]|uniref:hypothetical protein n=1 Tax=Streptomyces sp. NPDC050564 TaxID=3365631 RepID=UPI0037A81708
MNRGNPSFPGDIWPDTPATDIRQHRWQKLKMLLVRRRFREFCSGLFSDGKATIVTLAGIGNLLSGLVAFIPGLAV